MAGQILKAIHVEGHVTNWLGKNSPISPGKSPVLKININHNSGQEGARCSKY